MKVKIEIHGNIDIKQLTDLRTDIDKFVNKYFQSFKFNVEILKGLEK